MLAVLVFGSLLVSVLSPVVAARRSHPHKSRRASQRCIGTITSFEDVKTALQCNTVNIKSFTVPAGKTLELNFLPGTKVNQLGGITFLGGVDWAGPLAERTFIDFNGNNQTWDANGAKWWDGKGSNGGRTKPNQALRIQATGNVENIYLLNSPVHAISVSNAGPLHLSGFTVDSQAARTNGGWNTDGFDISNSQGLTISGSLVLNQDDCVAINHATNFIFEGNTCVGGHGISIGSIKTGRHVQNVIIRNNQVYDSTQALRIKTYVGASAASVSNIVYEGNTGARLSDYGVLIEQDYTNEGPTTKPTNGVPIRNVSFSGSLSEFLVKSSATQVYVLCGKGTCVDPWNWGSLRTGGGNQGKVTKAVVKGWQANAALQWLANAKPNLSALKEVTSDPALLDSKKQDPSSQDETTGSDLTPQDQVTPNPVL